MSGQAESRIGTREQTMQTASTSVTDSSGSNKCKVIRISRFLTQAQLSAGPQSRMTTILERLASLFRRALHLESARKPLSTEIRVIAAPGHSTNVDLSMGHHKLPAVYLEKVC